MRHLVCGQSIEQTGWIAFHDEEVAVRRCDEAFVNRVVDQRDERIEITRDVEQADVLAMKAELRPRHDFRILSADGHQPSMARD